MDRALPPPKTEENPTTPTNKPRVTLSAYVERVKHLQLDPWQLDLCARLERAFWLARAEFFTFKVVDIGAGPAYVVAPSGFKIDKGEFEQNRARGTRAAIHAPPQFGKSIIISQAYPAWILGYDPTHRFRLATYNISHSKAFSEVILNILRSPEHKAIFTDPAGHVPERVATVKWYTNARRVVNDGQSSFTALGLQSGFVGTGADTLLMDDPYKSIEEALSDIIRDKTWRFYTDTAEPRLDIQSNAFIMFHRYHEDDMAGRAIATGDFDLLRYAAEADGDYEDHETGRIFRDPLGREVGEYLSPRKPREYYERQKKNPQVWNSQFQGRPTSEAGDFFNVKMFQEIMPQDVPELIHTVRAWDNAATEGAGAYTVGDKRGVDASGNFYVLDVVREQLNSAQREALQLKTAEEDGKLVSVHAPQDPGSAGKDTAFRFRQALRDFQVFTDPVSGSKEMRAYPYSVNVNGGKYYLVLNPDGSRPDWFKAFINDHKNFPVGTTKDCVDAGADGDKFLNDLFYHGLVVKGFDERTHLVPWSRFRALFGEKIPQEWEVSAAIRVEADASKPSGWAILTRASEAAGIGEVVFVVASARLYTDNRSEVIRSLKSALRLYCEAGEAQVVWLSKNSANIVQLASVKHSLDLDRFEDEQDAGLSETNWYFRKEEGRNPFNPRGKSSHCYVLVEDRQYRSPEDEAGQLSFRQDIISWSYNEKGEPQPFGGVTVDCARMTLYNFALSATEMTKRQRQLSQLPEHLRPEAVKALKGQPGYVEAISAAEHALSQIERRDTANAEEEGKQWSKFMTKPVQNRKYSRRK